jgi:hypothetical protein
MASSERGGLVEEEQFRITAGRHKRRPTSAAKPQATSNPSFCSVKPANRSSVVVKAPAVAVDEPSLAGRDQISQGRDAVLKWHTSRLDGAGHGPPPRNPITRGRIGVTPLSAFPGLGDLYGISRTMIRLVPPLAPVWRPAVSTTRAPVGRPAKSFADRRADSTRSSTDVLTGIVRG